MIHLWYANWSHLISNKCNDDMTLHKRMWSGCYCWKTLLTSQHRDTALNSEQRLQHYYGGRGCSLSNQTKKLRLLQKQQKACLYIRRTFNEIAQILLTLTKETTVSTLWRAVTLMVPLCHNNLLTIKHLLLISKPIESELLVIGCFQIEWIAIQTLKLDSWISALFLFSPKCQWAIN